MGSLKFFFKSDIFVLLSYLDLHSTFDTIINNDTTNFCLPLLLDIEPKKSNLFKHLKDLFHVNPRVQRHEY